jgi:hypothetical protein
VYCIVVGSWIPVSGSVSTGSNAFDEFISDWYFTTECEDLYEFLMSC